MDRRGSEYGSEWFSGSVLSVQLAAWFYDCVDYGMLPG